MDDKVSILVPVFNAESFLPRCLDSILEQTFTNLEIILVDDGSVDQSGVICDRYALNDKRIQVFHQPNGGPAVARNKALDKMSGEFLIFIDSDDWVENNYIECMLSLQKEHDADLVICDYHQVSEGSDLNSLRSQSDPVITRLDRIDALKALLSERNEQFVVPWGKLYRASLFDNLRYPEGKIHEDEFICYRILFRSDRIIQTNKKLVYYWKRQGSITGTTFRLNYILNKIEALEERIDFFNQIGQSQLSAKTYRNLFALYRLIDENRSSFSLEEDKSAFAERFRQLRNALRMSSQSISFRIFYELYYLSPGMLQLAYRAYAKVKRLNE